MAKKEVGSTASVERCGNNRIPTSVTGKSKNNLKFAQIERREKAQ